MSNTYSWRRDVETFLFGQKKVAGKEESSLIFSLREIFEKRVGMAAAMGKENEVLFIYRSENS